VISFKVVLTFLFQGVLNEDFKNGVTIWANMWMEEKGEKGENGEKAVRRLFTGINF
jgi:hypothetical protein